MVTEFGRTRNSDYKRELVSNYSSEAREEKSYALKFVILNWLKL